MEPYVPNIKRTQALGRIPKPLEFAFRDLPAFFTPLPKPDGSEWLDSQKETGQTFAEYVPKARVPGPRNSKIYILPLDPSIDTELLNFLEVYAEAFFQPMKIKIMPTVPVEELQVDSRINEYSGKRQYHALQINEKLKSLRPKDAYCMIGITMEDLYPRDSWNYVFGWAFATTGVFSFCRFIENASRQQVLYWSTRVMTHEIGHMFGIKHCIYYSCLMNGFNSAEEAATRPAHLCPVCLLKMQHCLKFDIVQRYRTLAALCGSVDDQKFAEEADWYARRADAIRAPAHYLGI